MKRLIAIIITFAMLIGAAPLAVFAGGGNDFPSEPCINEGDPIRSEGEYEFDYDGSGVYINLYTGTAGMYTIESESDLDLYCYVYDSEGQQLGYDDDSGEGSNFKCYCALEYRTNVYIYVGAWGSPSGHVKVTVSRSDVQSVDVISWPTKTTYLPTDRTPDLTGLALEINYKNGDKATWMPAATDAYSEVESPDGIRCNYYFEDEVTAGCANRVWFSCYGYNFSYDVSFRAYYFDEARVTRMPYKTDYIVGLEDHSFYSDGMLIQLYNNGSPVETVNFRNDSPTHPFFQEAVTPNEYSLGANVVTIRFTNGVTAELTVNGVENPFASIEFVKLPDKTVYDTTPNDFFPAPDLTGAVLRINYKDGTHYDYTFGRNYDLQILGHYFISDFADGLSVGTNTVIFGYCDMTCSFNVTGVASKIKSIELTKLPDRTEYYIGEEHPSIKGATLKINYTDNTYKTINFTSENRYVDGFYIDFWFDNIPVVGANTATLWYGGESVTIDVTFLENDVKRVTVAKNPDKTEYSFGSIVRSEDLNGLVLNVTYKDGTMESWDFTANGGLFKGVQVFDTAYIQSDGYNAVDLDMAGHPATVYLLAKDFYVMNHSIVRNADASGNNATVEFTLETGGKFNVTFVGQFNKNDYASGYLTLPEYGTFSYSIYRNIKRADVTGVLIYVFDLEIFVPCDDGHIEPYSKGDMDGDGEITVADALKALRIAAKLVAPTAQDIELGDVDNDGEITVADALKILRVAAKFADPSSLG